MFPGARAMAKGVVISPGGGIREYLDMANRVTDAVQDAYPDLMKVIDSLSQTWNFVSDSKVIY